MPDLKRERFVIEKFCKRLSMLVREDCVAESWPDSENREPGTCDAILKRGVSSWALDHTHLNSFRGHVKDNVLFNSIILSLQSSLAPICHKHHINVVLDIRKLPRGRSETMRQLEASLLRIIPTVVDDGNLHRITLDSPACEIHVSRLASELAGCFFHQLAPEGHNIELCQDIERAIRQKSKQLKRYKAEGKRTILLLDTDEISLINEFTVADAFATATAQIDHSCLDEVFLFDQPVGTDVHFVWPLKFRGVFQPDRRWLHEFRRAQGVLLWNRDDQGPPYIEDIT
jgi:hypothetical protein